MKRTSSLDAETLGWIGFGNFGRFFLPHLKPYFSISVYDVLGKEEDIQVEGYSSETLAEVASKDIVLLAVPVQFLKSVLQNIAPHLKPGALVMDVSSVKVRPTEWMLTHLPAHVDIVGTHPLFGPQSGKNGIAGLNLVLCPVRTNKLELLHRFFGETLKLNVLERTPETHDQQMGYVQALTHFIGRAINEMDIPDVEQKTPAYQYLLEIKRNLGQDSIDLFYTIETENPYAKGIREHFIQELRQLEERIQNHNV
jgi:prephenate dehydrogenase